jgi:diguanylate cyclase (GGDEF)-like protein
MEKTETNTLYDPLTRLRDRPLFEEMLLQAVNLSRRWDRVVALLWMDLQFSGDVRKPAVEQLLAMAARRIKDTVRDSDVTARVGVMELAVAFTDLMSPGDAEWATQRLHHELSQPLVWEGKSIFSTIRTGISLYPIDGADIQKLMADAAAASRRVRGDSQACYQFASSDIKASAVDKIALEKSLDRAIRKKELALYYQPEFDLSSGKVVGLETLAHWRHPELGLLPARHWMPLAEDFGRSVDIDTWVLNTATRQYQKWLSQGSDPLELSFNISAGQLMNRKFPQIVEAALSDSDMDPRLLVLEFSEDAIIRSAAVAFRTLTRLSHMGVRISIDDFGLGYASLNQLKIYPFNGLKIDRSLISNIDKETYDKTILKAIIAMAHEVGLTVTAVGMESDAQAEILKMTDCDRAQGFLFGRPMSAEEVVGLLNLQK